MEQLMMKTFERSETEKRTDDSSEKLQNPQK